MKLPRKLEAIVSYSSSRFRCTLALYFTTLYFKTTLDYKTT